MYTEAIILGEAEAFHVRCLDGRLEPADKLLLFLDIKIERGVTFVEFKPVQFKRFDRVVSKEWLQSVEHLNVQIQSHCRL